jgi:hypothetical protein
MMEQIKNPKGCGAEQSDGKNHKQHQAFVQCDRTVFAFEGIAHAEQIF